MSVLSMSLLTIKNLFSKPRTRRYPKVKREPFSASRGEIKIEIEKCIFCSLCAKKCPTQALVVDKEAKTWEIDHLRCIMCRFCVEVCPKKCLFQERVAHIPTVAREKHLHTQAQ